MKYLSNCVYTVQFCTKLLVTKLRPTGWFWPIMLLKPIHHAMTDALKMYKFLIDKFSIKKKKKHLIDNNKIN